MSNFSSSDLRKVSSIADHSASIVLSSSNSSDSRVAIFHMS